MRSSILYGIFIASLIAIATIVVEFIRDRLGLAHPSGEGGRVLVVGAVALLAAHAVILPSALMRARGAQRLGAALDRAARGEGFALGEVPASLRAIAAQVQRVLESATVRERELRKSVREVEVRLRVSEADRARDESVLEVLADAVVVTDGFDEVVLANGAAGRSLGFDPDEASHAPISKLVSDEAICRMIAETREHGTDGATRRAEHELRVGSGASERRTTYDVALTRVTGEGRESAGVVTVLHDLTRERELSQMKTDFVAKASHELRTPLSSIRAYVEMLVDGEAADEESRAEFYQIIQSETDRLGRLIDNMLNISRIEAGIVQIDRVEVDVRPIIERAVSTIEPQAQEKGITLNARLADLDLCVEGDSDMLYQVVLNLVSNAVKYTPDGGRVTITADSDNLTRSVVVSVADTGFGIPPDSIERVFEKFYRVDNYKRVAKGTGLGLSLCKHIVETVHRGQIGVESKLGLGSKFWFSVPMRYAGMRSAA